MRNSGMILAAIAAELNEGGQLTPRGATRKASGIRRVLRSLAIDDEARAVVAGCQPGAQRRVRRAVHSTAQIGHGFFYLAHPIAELGNIELQPREKPDLNRSNGYDGSPVHDR